MAIAVDIAEQGMSVRAEAQFAGNAMKLRRADEVEGLLAGRAGIGIDFGKVDPVALSAVEVGDGVVAGARS